MLVYSRCLWFHQSTRPVTVCTFSVWWRRKGNLTNEVLHRRLQQLFDSCLLSSAYHHALVLAINIDNHSSPVPVLCFSFPAARSLD
ncbi:hypothetical protein LDENG_00128060 [Lucifuga dentata]|nr:hypothetical protein LDENG_00128060 [Lucifuga dentata]